MTLKKICKECKGTGLRDNVEKKRDYSKPVFCHSCNSKGFIEVSEPFKNLSPEVYVLENKTDLS